MQIIMGVQPHLYTEPQWLIIKAERKARGCTNAKYPSPEYIDEDTPGFNFDNSQVMMYLRCIRAGYIVHMKAGHICQSLFNLVEHLDVIRRECETIHMQPGLYPGITCFAYVQTLLEQAHSGGDIDTNATPGTPRPNIISLLSLRRRVITTRDPLPPVQPRKRDPNGDLKGDPGAMNRQCYNHAKGYGIFGEKHTANACPLPCKIPCGYKGCKELHKRGECAAYIKDGAPKRFKR